MRKDERAGVSTNTLARVNGGRQQAQRRQRGPQPPVGPHSALGLLTRFAHDEHFTITSTTGGHHLGRAHRMGHAIDVRTRGKSRAEISGFIRRAHQHGFWVNDERLGGNAAWSGPHLHLEKW